MTSFRPVCCNSSMQICYLISIVFLFASWSCSGSQLLVSSSETKAQQYIEIPGDIILGGLFPVHRRGPAGSDHCGHLRVSRGIHRVEAMLFALDKVNADPNLLPGVKLGALILDTCTAPAHALKQSLSFLRGHVAASFFANLACNNTGIEGKVQPVPGVIGASSSSVTHLVAHMLRLFKIVQISPASTSSILSDKIRYNYFARTVPSDSVQAHVLVDLVMKFNWTYLSLIYSTGSYGESGAMEFRRLARAENINIVYQHRIRDHSRMSDVVEGLVQRSGGEPIKQRKAKAVILFTTMADTRALLTAADKIYHRVHKNLVWLGTDAFHASGNRVAGLERIAEGAIFLELESSRVPEFEDYFLSLHPDHPKFSRNPWLVEFWEQKFQCKLTEQSMAPFSEICPDSLRLDPMEFQPDHYVQFVIDAVYAMAHSLHNLATQACEDHKKFRVCPALRSVDGEALFQDLLSVNFTDIVGRHVHFDDNGDVPAYYNIFKYQMTNTGGYENIKLGTWRNGVLAINKK